ncbi:MAG: hypothetical protein JRD94_11025 [Deltaproteobacteria bacterium]|nr:hypothetical protein [Deltaproteobacteria bacterium]
MHAPLREPLTRPVQFFTGKGGVGKSTVLGAVATSAARSGKRPLIVELGLHTSSSRLFHGPVVGYEPAEVASGVYATRVQFDGPLRPSSLRILRYGVCSWRLREWTSS